MANSTKPCGGNKMSKFEVKVVAVDSIEPIEGADAIELARIKDFRSVVKKGDFKAGDVGVYIPENAIVPDELLAEMNLIGKLAGSAKNRVKAIRLRGCLSQGLLYKPKKDDYKEYYDYEDEVLAPGSGLTHLEMARRYLHIDDNVADEMGITKYEPEIPTSMGGEVANIGSENTVSYDIENLKKYPHVLAEGEEVVVTEKLHGTFCVIGYIPGLDHPEMFEDGEVFTASKGLGSRGLVFKNNEKNKNNVYVQNLVDLTEGVGFNIIDAIKHAFIREEVEPKPVYIMGEIFGKGIQDLSYNQPGHNFRVFDIYVGKPGLGKYLDYEMLEFVCKEYLDLGMVPVLYKGPFNRTKIDELAAGLTIMGDGKHIREGIVIKPTMEREDSELGRVNLKHINEEYLLRKGGTEYN